MHRFNSISNIVIALFVASTLFLLLNGRLAHAREDSSEPPADHKDFSTQASRKSESMLKNLNVLISRGLWRDALKYIDVCLKSLDPKDSETRYIFRTTRAGCLYNLGQYQESLAEVEPLIANRPLTFTLCSTKVACLKRLKKAEAALQFLDEQLRKGLKYYWIYLERVFVNEELGRCHDALRDIDAGLKIGSLKARFLYERAALLKNLGRYEEAKIAITRGLEELIKEHYLPHERGTYLTLRAVILDQLGQFDRALADIDLAISYDSKILSNWEIKTQILVNMGAKPKTTIAAYDQCLKLNPRSSGIHYKRGLYCLDNQYLLESAVRDFDLALANGGVRYMILSARQEVYQSLGRTEEAIADMTTLIDDPDTEFGEQTIEYLFQRGRLYEKTGRYRLAIADFDKILSHEKLDYVLARRALINLGIGDLSAARRDIDEALRLRPDAFNYLRQRAVISYKQGDRETALRDLNKCIEQDNTSASSFELRARILERQGKRELAASDRKTVKRMLEQRQKEKPTLTSSSR
ncbi:MAG: hypothetical protein K2Z81_13340 [Cyanobacteria bacterium]|nr:hypothetical protein [Cyanobacteriota bacterium]